jgi:hypothetical protein
MDASALKAAFAGRDGLWGGEGKADGKAGFDLAAGPLAHRVLHRLLTYSDLRAQFRREFALQSASRISQALLGATAILGTGNRTVLMPISIRPLSLGLAAATLCFGPMSKAGTEFLPYEGKNTVQEGQGGTRKTVNGVDFWEDGAPPRRFQILGTITDRRRSNGLFSHVGALEGDLVKLIKAQGGDAAIRSESQNEVIGVQGTSNGFAWGNRNWASGFGGSYAAPVTVLNTRWTVVKYLPDETPPAPQERPTGSTNASAPPPTPPPPPSPPPSPTPHE